MAIVEMVMPKMGESVMEGTILSWLKKEGDSIEEDESVLEVATDKVDTEVPASQAGILKEILAKEGDVVQVGNPIALIETEADSATPNKGAVKDSASPKDESSSQAAKQVEEEPVTSGKEPSSSELRFGKQASGKFFSPLVVNIAKQEGLSQDELNHLSGSGKEGRVTKKDVLDFIEKRKSGAIQASSKIGGQTPQSRPAVQQVPISIQGNDEIIEMDRMRKMIAERMLASRRISAHVTSFVEADVSAIVNWRSRRKNAFKDIHQTHLTFTPIFIEAVVKAINDFPMINVSVDGNRIIKRGNVNIGMAVALPSGNLIVPVIKNADQLNLVGITKQVNDLARRARDNKLKTEDLEGGTYTISNVGSFGNVMGTPIIMQPQVGILALGAIQKKPAVIEGPEGDSIAIRHKMFLSHSYDHRVVDGALGGMFVRRVADYLEQFDTKRDF